MQTPHPLVKGKICVKHPELDGMRRVKHHLCPLCFAASRKAYKERRIAETQAEHAAIRTPPEVLERLDTRKPTVA